MPGGRRGSRSASSHSSSSVVAASRRASENPHFWKNLLIVSDLTLSQADVSHRMASNTVTFFAMSDAVLAASTKKIMCRRSFFSVHHVQVLDACNFEVVFGDRKTLTFSNMGMETAVIEEEQNLSILPANPIIIPAHPRSEQLSHHPGLIVRRLRAVMSRFEEPWVG